MSWLDTLARVVTGSEQAVVHEAIPELQAAHAGFVQRARLMRQHAELAPNRMNQDELHRLADEDEAQAKRVLELLVRLGSAATAAAGEPPPPAALNHWGRLVQDLEAHRAAMRRFREEAVHFAETLPETGKLFDQLCAEEEAHALRLRDLIARTDPQALD